MTDPTADPALLPGKPAALPLVKPGKSGLLSFVLVQTSPDPPAEDTNIWTIKVLDGSGAARKDATVSFPPSIVGIQPWMPKMKHGSLPAKATNNGDGTYTISNMNLFMTGIWQLTVQAQVSDALPIGDAGDTGADAGDTDAQAAGSMTDQATFTWCVP